MTQLAPTNKGLPQRLLNTAARRQVHLLIGATLLLCLALPLALSGARLLLVIGLALVSGVAVVFLYRPVWGLLLLFVTGLLAPSPPLPGGLNFAVLHLIMLVGLWLLHLIVSRPTPQLIQSRPIRPLYWLLGVIVLAFTMGQLPWFVVPDRAPIATQLGAMMIFGLAIGAFLLVAHQVTAVRGLAWMTWLLISLGGIFALGWVSPLGIITARVFQVAATANALFWTWLIALSFSQAVFHETLQRRWRVLAGAIFLLAVYVAFVRQYEWKSAWLPPLIALFVMLAAYSWRLGAILAVIGSIATILLGARIIASDAYSYSTRLDAGLIMVEMLKTNPILGFGPANYYWYTPLFHIRGYTVQFNSHNQYLDILAQTGVLGLACVLWFFGELGWLIWRLRRQAPAGFMRAYLTAALGGLAGTAASGMLVDWFFPFVYNIGFNGFRSTIFAWLFLGGVVSIEQLLQRPAIPAHPQLSFVTTASQPSGSTAATATP